MKQSRPTGVVKLVLSLSPLLGGLLLVWALFASDPEGAPSGRATPPGDPGSEGMSVPVDPPGPGVERQREDLQVHLGGRVVDCAGSPLAGIGLELHAATGEPLPGETIADPSVLHRVATTATGDDGGFLIRNRYLARAGQMEVELSIPRVPVGFLPWERRRITPADLQAEEGLGICLRRECTISGRVLIDARQGGSVWAWQVDGQGRATGLVRNGPLEYRSFDGTSVPFTITGLSRGAWLLGVTAHRVGGIGRVVELQGGDRLEDQQLTADSRGSLELDFVDAGGRPWEGEVDWTLVLREATPAGGEGTIRVDHNLLLEEPWLGAGWFAFGESTWKPGERIRRQGLPAGRYRLYYSLNYMGRGNRHMGATVGATLFPAIHSPDQGYGEESGPGATPIHTADLVVDNSVVRRSITVPAGPTGLLIVRVVDSRGKPVARAGVVLSVATAKGNCGVVSWQDTGPYGCVLFKPLLAGSYRVDVHVGGGDHLSTRMFSPDRPEPFTVQGGAGHFRRALSVTLKPGAMEVLEKVTIKVGGTLALTVRSRAGRSLAGRVIQARLEGGNPTVSSRDRDTDKRIVTLEEAASGTVRMTGLRPGRWLVWSGSEAGPVDPIHLDIEEGTVREATLSLP